MTQIATGAQHDLFYVAESTRGTTPATPAFTPLPHTGFTGGISRDSIEDPTLRGDRQVEDLRLGNIQSAPTVSAVLDYSTGMQEMLQAVMMGTWTTNVLKAGTVNRYYTLERHFLDLATPAYFRYTGCEANTMSLTVTSNDNVNVEFGFVGANLDSANLTSQVAGATYAARSSVRPFDSFTGSINEGGSASGIITDISLELSNGAEAQYALMNQESICATKGKSRLTGSLTAFFTSTALYEKFASETATTLDFTLTDPAGNDLVFNMDNVQYTAGNPDVSSDGVVLLPLEFTALYDATLASQISITRVNA